MNAAEMARYTTRILTSRAAYHKDTKCDDCGVWLPIGGQRISARCESCTRFYDIANKRAAYDRKKNQR